MLTSAKYFTLRYDPMLEFHCPSSFQLLISHNVVTYSSVRFPDVPTFL